MKLGRHGPQCPVFKKGICSLIHNYVYYKKNIGHHRTDAVSISKVRSEKNHNHRQAEIFRSKTELISVSKHKKEIYKQWMQRQLN